MTQPGRPIPGPPHPGPGLGPGLDPALAQRLHGLPVAEHAAVLEVEHDRLQRRLATIDQL